MTKNRLLALKEQEILLVLNLGEEVMRSHSKFALFVLLGVLTYSYPALTQDGDPLLASIHKAGELKVAIGSVPPWIYLSPNGEAKGFQADVMNLVVKGMGLPPITPRLIGWGGQIPALLAHQVDMIAPSLAITEDRCKVVAFSDVIAVRQNALFVRPGNPKHLTGYSQIAHRPEIKLAVVTGSVQDAYAAALGIKAEQLVRVPDNQAGVATVTGGRADAVALSSSAIPNPEQKGVESVVDPQAPVNGFAVLFRKEDLRFRDAFNKQLDALRSNGMLKDLVVNAGAASGLSEAERAVSWDLLSKYRKPSDLVPGCG
ncbi:transporter substrate-binding domain-containing protein [Bradyrhizobium sp. WSM 1738]|nr:transporter substrate-binding domain-containing protein [Bradyrhizobium hereditatis]